MGSRRARRPHTSGSNGVSWTSAAIMFVLAWLLLRGRIGRAFRAVRDSPVAAASSGVALPIYKTLAFGSPPPSPASPGRSCPRHERIRPAERVRRPALARDPDRRSRPPASLPLGRARRRPLHRLLPTVSADVPLIARPTARRRLRPDRDPDHAPAAERLRRSPRPARRQQAGPIVTQSAVDSSFNFTYLIDPRAS